jgi:dCMP deaminase
VSKNRPSKLQTAMDIAEAVSKRSHDAETQVGAVLIKQESGAIIATGFNGFVRGAPDDKLPNVRPDKYRFILHAEQNLICNCVRHGISMEDTFVVCLYTPCTICMRLLWNAGVKNIIAKNKYRDFDDILKMEDLQVIEETTEDGFIKLTYINP